MKKITITYPLSQKVEIATRLGSLADSRTRHLHRELAYRPLGDLLANAWLQGLTDAIDTLDNAGKLK